MNPEGYVLDTSAILTLIEDEEGAERVEDVLRNETVWLPWVVLVEVVYITRRERGVAEADRRYGVLKQLPVTIVWEAVEPVLLIAARLKADNHLSLADAIIAAYAIYLNATLLHKDPELGMLSGEVIQEVLVYK